VCLEGIIAFSKNGEEETKLEMWLVQDGSKALERLQALSICESQCSTVESQVACNHFDSIARKILNKASDGIGGCH
jgi:hypothetical protein